MPVGLGHVGSRFGIVVVSSSESLEEIRMYPPSTLSSIFLDAFILLIYHVVFFHVRRLPLQLSVGGILWENHVLDSETNLEQGRRHVFVCQRGKVIDLLALRELFSSMLRRVLLCYSDSLIALSLSFPVKLTTTIYFF